MIPWLISFILGFSNAIFWVAYMRATAACSPLRAALADGALLIAPYAVLQLWALNAHDLGIFVSMVLGSILGTYWKAR